MVISWQMICFLVAAICFSISTVLSLVTWTPLFFLYATAAVLNWGALFISMDNAMEREEKKEKNPKIPENDNG